MTRLLHRHRRQPSTERERTLGILAVLLALALGATFVVVVPEDSSRVLDEGESLPLQAALYNGAPHEVTVPGATITLQVGEPVDEVARDQVDLGDDVDRSATAPLRPATGLRLVPVSWTVRPTRGSPGQEDPDPVELTLVADDDETDLDPVDSTRASGARVLAVDQAVGHSDLGLEVTYDGATQVLHPATGEVDAGGAEGVDEPARSIPTGCEDFADQCRFTARGATWRPPSNEAKLTVGDLRINAHDDDLGWAGPGRRWVSTSIQLSGTADVEDAAGNHRSVERLGRLVATLDGEEPESTSGLGPLEPFQDAQGRVAFSVDAESPPEELVLRQQLTLEGDERPRTVTMKKEIDLDGHQ